MPSSNNLKSVNACLKELSVGSFSPLDILSSRTLPEKMIELSLQGVPEGPPLLVAGLKHLQYELNSVNVEQVRVVVFGGGTGVSTIIGGDSRSMGWMAEPFYGLKAVFPKTKAIVCVTDDGGSTGELLKDLPLIGLGDLRHVLLSSIQKTRLCKLYGLNELQAMQTAATLFILFNYRYFHCPATIDDLLGNDGVEIDQLPKSLRQGLLELLEYLFNDSRLTPTLVRPHCLGNLLITSAIYQHYKGGDEIPPPAAVREGLRFLAKLLAVPADAVLPCTTTPSQLKISYTNGVRITGECKSGSARRGYPVDQVSVDFARQPPHVLPEVVDAIRQADIIVYAPGSLYTSIVPVMQVPGLAQAVRDNKNALKVLVANLWVQSGETDLSIEDPSRRFYVSDLLKAYQRNIPGGVDGLFKQIMLLNMSDIPGSILQRYAVEGKMPIYLDRQRVFNMGFLPLEAGIFSKEGLADRTVKHDPAALSIAMKTMWATGDIETSAHRHICIEKSPAGKKLLKTGASFFPACERYGQIYNRLVELNVEELDDIIDIIWRHPDISVGHLDYVRGLRFVPLHDWKRCQEWDNIYSFFDPDDFFLNIREDMRNDPHFEVAFLVALGQSLLGNYCLDKKLQPLEINGEQLGKIYRLKLRPVAERRCFFNDEELRQYLNLSRMQPSRVEDDVFTRILSGDDGFTPPGFLFGLSYAWYIDNRFAPHIEYKMAIARAEVSNAVPEQVKTLAKRRALVDFFSDVVFRI